MTDNPRSLLGLAGLVLTSSPVESAAELAEAADLIPRAEVVAWLEAQALPFAEAAAPLPAGDPAFETVRAALEGSYDALREAAEALKAGNPWEADHE